MSTLSRTSRPRSLAHELVDQLSGQIRQGRLAPGDKLPSEGQVMQQFGVSRTVVREALSRLQAAGLVATRHGVGTFVADQFDEPAFRLAPQQLETLRDVIAVLELRIAVETEAAGLAALRRTDANLAVMRAALDEFAAAVEARRDAIAADVRFHGEIARATQNEHFAALMATLGARLIPRARLEGEHPPEMPVDEPRRQYLRRVNAEHESIFDALQRRDADGARAAMRTHLVNSRERRRRAAEV